MFKKEIPDHLRNIDKKIIDFINSHNAQIQDPRKVNTNGLLSFKVYEIIISSKLSPSLQSSVYRRYSDFSWLYNKLKLLYFGKIVPKLPGKNIAANIDKESPKVVERRRRQLDSFLNRLLRIDDFKYSEELYQFLTLQHLELEQYMKDYVLLADVSMLRESGLEPIKKLIKIGLQKAMNPINGNLMNIKDLQRIDGTEFNDYINERYFEVATTLSLITSMKIQLEKYEHLIVEEKSHSKEISNYFLQLFGEKEKDGQKALEIFTTADQYQNQHDTLVGYLIESLEVPHQF